MNVQALLVTWCFTELWQPPKIKTLSEERLLLRLKYTWINWITKRAFKGVFCLGKTVDLSIARPKGIHIFL